MNVTAFNILSRFFALSVSLSLALPGPAFALRTEAGLESTTKAGLVEALQGNRPAYAAGLEEGVLIAYPGGTWTTEQLETLRQWKSAKRAIWVQLTPGAAFVYRDTLRDIPENRIYQATLDGLSYPVGEAADVSQTDLYLGGGTLGLEPNQGFVVPLGGIEWISATGPIETDEAEELRTAQTQKQNDQDLDQFLAVLRAAERVERIVRPAEGYEVPSGTELPYAVYPQADLLIVNVPTRTGYRSVDLPRTDPRPSLPISMRHWFSGI